MYTVKVIPEGAELPIIQRPVPGLKDAVDLLKQEIGQTLVENKFISHGRKVKFATFEERVNNRPLYAYHTVCGMHHLIDKS